MVLLPVTDHGRADGMGKKQLAGVPGILGGDQLHLAKYLQGPQGDVLQVADRSGYHIKAAGLLDCIAQGALILG